MLKIYQLDSVPLHNHIQKQINGNVKARGKPVELQSSNFVYLSDSSYLVDTRTQTAELLLYHNGSISATQQGVLLQGMIGKIVDAIAYVNAVGEKQACCGGRNICPCESCCRTCCCLIWYHAFVRIDSVDIEEMNVSDLAKVKITYTMQLPYWEVLNRSLWRYDNLQYADFATAAEEDVPNLAKNMLSLLPRCGDFYKPCGAFRRRHWDDYQFLINPIYMNEFYCGDYNGVNCQDIKQGGGIGFYKVGNKKDEFDIHVDKFFFNAPSNVTYIIKNFGQVGSIRISNKYYTTMKKETASLTIDVAEIADLADRNNVTHVGSDYIIINESIDGYAQVRSSTGAIKLYIGSAIVKNKQWGGEFYPGLNHITLEQLAYAKTFTYGVVYTHRSF